MYNEAASVREGKANHVRYSLLRVRFFVKTSVDRTRSPEMNSDIRECCDGELKIGFEAKPCSLKPGDYSEILKLLKQLLATSQVIENYTPSINDLPNLVNFVLCVNTTLISS